MDSQDWKRVAIAVAVVVITLVVAKLVDRAISRRLRLTPEAMTRYRVLRRSLMVVIVVLGTLSALLVIPEVRAVAGGVLASSAVVALVIGMAAHSTLANFVAGMLIAVTQPFRLGDEIEIDDASGVVEEIALTYTTIREPGGARFYVPNEKLASDTIRNATIAGAEHLAQVKVPVPLDSDLDRVVTLVEEEARAVSDSPEARPIATVTDFDSQANKALITIEARTPQGRAEATSAELRRAVHKRLRAEGLI